MGMILKGLLLASFAAIAMGLMCNSGRKNFAVDEVTQVECNTACVKSHYTVLAKRAGKKVRFAQTELTCADGDNNVCKNRKKRCQQIRRLMKTNAGSLPFKKMRARRCRTRCCRRSLCNIPSGSYQLHSKITIPATPSPTSMLSPSSSSSPASSSGSFICKAGSKNYVQDAVYDVPCTTSCQRVEMEVHAMGSGTWFSFHQTAFSCATPLECVHRDSSQTCKNMRSIIDGIQSSFPAGLHVTVRNCQEDCCSTDNCNAPLPSTAYILDLNPSSYAETSTLIAETIPQFTQSTLSGAFVPTQLPFVPPSGGVTSCNSGAKNYAVDNVHEVPCQTACLSMEGDFVGKVKYAGEISFHQTTYQCVVADECVNQKRYCETIQTGLQRMSSDAGISDMTMRNCRVDCCYSSNCKAPDPSREYKLNFGKFSGLIPPTQQPALSTAKTADRLAEVITRSTTVSP